MQAIANAFSRHLSMKGIKFSNEVTKTGKDLIRVRYDGENKETIEVLFVFDDTGTTLSVKSWTIANFNGDKYANGILLANKLNSDWRWIRFYIDSDNDLDADADLYVTIDTAGEICEYILHKFVNIIDKIYPEVMKARFAN